METDWTKTSYKQRNLIKLIDLYIFVFSIGYVGILDSCKSHRKHTFVIFADNLCTNI